MERIAILIPDLRGGGAEKAVCNLLEELCRRGAPMEIDLVMVKAGGVFLKDVPPSVRIVDLGRRRAVSAIFPLVGYLRKNRPSFLISHLSHINIIAAIAVRLAGTKTPLVMVEHGLLPADLSFPGKEWWVRWGMKKYYPSAAAVVAVADYTARDLALQLGFPEGKVQRIYNPVVTAALKEQAKEIVSHPWFGKKEAPVILGAGRLVGEKDFDTLIRAFAELRKKGPAKLVILGEGPLRDELAQTVSRLGIAEDVWMPGFVENPYAYMRTSDLFVLSSLREGLGNVLIEAMACGCPVVATDCPGGPREILQDGVFGILVPVGDAGAMAVAMRRVLDAPASRERLVQRAERYSAERAGGEWMSLLGIRADAGVDVVAVDDAGDGAAKEVNADPGGDGAAEGVDVAAYDARKRQVVLHVITGLRTGGAERMLCQLLSAMDRQRWDPVVISLTDGSSPETWLREQGIPVYCLGMQPGRLPSFAVLRKLIRLVRQIRPALIQGWMYHGNLAAQFANFFLSPRAAVLWSIHHSIGELAAEKKTTIQMIRLGARLSGLPDKIVYASRVSRDQHISLGYCDGKGCWIPNAVDTALFVPSPEARAGVREELGLSPAALVIGSLARYHPMKDHANFLRAAGLLVRRLGDVGAAPEGAVEGVEGEGGMTIDEMGPTGVRCVSGEEGGARAADIQFLLAGTGVDAGNAALAALIQEEGLEGRVHLLGERADTARILAALDIFCVSSSRGEALPMVLLEAMSCGVPCVTTDVGDAAAVVGDTGRVVAPRDPGALAAAWEELVMGSARRGTAGAEGRALGEAARQKIIMHYALSVCARSYEELYRSLRG